MCSTLRQVNKPCLGFKIPAAGRKGNSSGDVREAFQFAFTHLKPTDAVIVGMFPRFKDQVAENTSLVHELAA